MSPLAVKQHRHCCSLNERFIGARHLRNLGGQAITVDRLMHTVGLPEEVCV